MLTYRRRFTLTQGNAAPTDIRLHVAPAGDGYLEIDSVRVGPDDYAVGGRTLSVQVVDVASGQVVESLGDVAALDNAPVHSSPVVTGTTQAANNVARRAGGPWVVHGGDALRVNVADAAQGEVLTVHVRGRTRVPITASSVTAGVTLLETEN